MVETTTAGSTFGNNDQVSKERSWRDNGYCKVDVLYSGGWERWDLILVIVVAVG